MHADEGRLRQAQPDLQGWSDREEAIVAAACHLGFRRTGANIRAAFKSAINAALRRGLIEANGPQQIRKMRNKG